MTEEHRHAQPLAALLLAWLLLLVQSAAATELEELVLLSEGMTG